LVGVDQNRQVLKNAARAREAGLDDLSLIAGDVREAALPHHGIDPAGALRPSRTA
jgi:hypothetical protein